VCHFRAEQHEPDAPTTARASCAAARTNASRSPGRWSGGLFLVLADEPTGALDSESGPGALELLRELHDDGTTIVVITHDHDVAKMLPRQVPIRDGQIETNER
jgi:DNA repair exonuclease SbcCD ATPase subunit